MNKIKIFALLLSATTGLYFSPIIGDKVRETEYRIISKYNDARRTLSAFIDPDDGDIRAIVHAEASLQGVNFALVDALIHIESNWNADALNMGNGNGTKDYGLMQVNSTHIKGNLCPESKVWLDLMNPRVNVRCGIRILKTSIDSTSTTKQALTKYNCGRVNCPQGEQHADKVLARLINGITKENL